MPSRAKVHVRDETPQSDGRYRAITLVMQPSGGFLGWAGILAPAAIDKVDDEISAGDFIERQTTSFVAWFAVWHYFEQQTEFADLVSRLRQRVEAVVPVENSGDSLPG